jgi:DNA-binding MarR family transcriptional regulator
MEDKQWIYREKEPEDGRSVRIFLTDLGKEKRNISRISVKEFNHRIRHLVKPEQLSVFFDVIRVIHKVADDKEYVNDFLSQMNVELT